VAFNSGCTSSWATASLQQNWWRSYGDPALNAHIALALSRNPDLGVLGARLQRARAQTRQAAAASWPSINLGTGLVFGNEQSRMTRFTPSSLEPWASSAAVSWEIDLFGKLRAATRSAQEAQEAAFWDLHAGRLLVATQVAGAHFRILDPDTSVIERWALVTLLEASHLDPQSCLHYLGARDGRRFLWNRREEILATLLGRRVKAGRVRI